MTDWQQSAAAHLDGGEGAVGRLEAADNFSGTEDWAPDSGPNIVSLGFLKAAIRRSATFCYLMAIAGLVIGIGIYKAFPASYQASTTLVLTEGPYENGLYSAQDDQSLAQTRTAAALAMHKMGAQQSITSFLKDYQVAVQSERVLVVTFAANSANQAVLGANAVGAALLQLRAGLLQQELEQVLASLAQQVTLAQQKLGSITAQVSQVSAQPVSHKQQEQLRSLQGQRTNAADTLASMRQAVGSTKASALPETMAAIKGSKAIDAAVPLPRPRLKRILLYSVAGLVGGLVIAIAIVLLRAIVSDRPRRRGDIADALRAPVVLSTGPMRAPRLLPARFWPRQAAAQRSDLERIVSQLRRSLRQRDRGAALLAVVAVDDPETAAMLVVSLATSQARQGIRVIVADLCNGAPAGRLLGVGSPGVNVAAEVPGLVVAVPEHDDLVPQGPLGCRESPQDQGAAFTDAVTSAYSGADVLLTLVSLDPRFGGEHLRTWADQAVVIVTAGRSSWTRISAVGELIRLSGTRLLSAILVAADRSDESLGATAAHQVQDPVATMAEADARTGADVTAEPAEQNGNGRVRVPDDPDISHAPASRDDLL